MKRADRLRLFFVCSLTILSMPMIVINTFGNGQIEAHQLLDLSLTTIGNLGDRHNISCTPPSLSLCP